MFIPSRFSITFLTMGVLAGCGLVSEPTPSKLDSSSNEAIRVTVAKPERATIKRSTEQPGQIQAFETTPVHARIGGYVKTVAVNIGDRVKEGQVLAVLEVPEVEAEAQQKLAMIEQAEADRTLSQASVEVKKSSVSSARAKAAEVQSTTRRTHAEDSRWEAEAARIEQLARESAVTGSLRDETRSKLEAARAAADEAKAQVRSAEAALGEAESELDKAKADVAASTARIKVARADAKRVDAMLGFARVTAPYDGVVTRRQIDHGHLTVPGGTAEPLFVVARTDVVTVVVAVPEAEAALVDINDAAKIRIQALGGLEVEGKVTRTSWALDLGNRSLRVEIDVPNPDGILRPGLYAYATIIAAEKSDVLTLPATAIFRDADKTFCVVVKDGKARRRPVRPGISDGTRVEILEGVSAADEVVTAGAETLSESQPVQAVSPLKPTESTKK